MTAPFHPVTVERVTSGAVDERGVPSQTWATSGTYSASNQPLSEQEVAQLSQGGPVAATHRIYILGAPDILEADRIIDGGKTYQIDSLMDPAGAIHHVEILAHVVTG